jgi:hypothetical protein
MAQKLKVLINELKSQIEKITLKTDTSFSIGFVFSIFPNEGPLLQ